jgi:hypothetical protein
MRTSKVFTATLAALGFTLILVLPQPQISAVSSRVRKDPRPAFG